MTGPPPPGPGGGSNPAPIQVNINLPGATPAAIVEFSAAVQAYADFLSNETQKQEISLRPLGSHGTEVTSNAVLRARRAISRFGERAKPGVMENAALAGVPIFSGAAGVMGGYLHSTLQWVVFSLLVLLALLCIAYTGVRRVSS